jgi:hypothetical protein
MTPVTFCPNESSSACAFAAGRWIIEEKARPASEPMPVARDHWVPSKRHVSPKYLARNVGNVRLLVRSDNHRHHLSRDFSRCAVV